MADTPPTEQPKQRSYLKMLQQRKERAAASGRDYYVPGESKKEGEANGDSKPEDKPAVGASATTDDAVESPPVASTRTKPVALTIPNPGLAASAGLSGPSLPEIQKLLDTHTKQITQILSQLIDDNAKRQRSPRGGAASSSHDGSDVAAAIKPLETSVKSLEASLRSIEDSIKSSSKKLDSSSLSSSSDAVQGIQATLAALELRNSTLLQRQAALERNLLQRESQNFENINRFLVLQFVMWFFMIIWFGFCYLSI